jgi:putative two-component system response regulator
MSPRMSPIDVRRKPKFTVPAAGTAFRDVGGIRRSPPVGVAMAACCVQSPYLTGINVSTLPVYRSDDAVTRRLQGLEALLPQLGRAELGEVLAPVVERMNERLPPSELVGVADAALAFCRRLYANARSGDALPLARAVLFQCSLASDPALERRAATACGLLAADTADIVGAIEYHVHALRLAEAASDRVEMSRVWNNLGLAMGIAANYEMAVKCYQRCLALLAVETEPVYSRYAAYVNLANSFYQLGAIDEGLECGQRALAEQTPAFREQDLHSALLVRSNLVRLLAAAGRARDGEQHVNEISALAERTRTPRALIAAATARALHELAVGRMDLALTRLDQALARAREVPAALRDTLACLVRAEEAAGNPGRALVRLNELSDHIYRSAIERARDHVELEGFAGRPRTRLELDQEQARARLVSQVTAPAQPDGWSALDRLSVSAVMRVDKTGWHGKRVGALTKALAMASGIDPLQALEMGLAAELHDIGMTSVPEGLLAKRGPLNAAERAVVRRHADAGAEILRDDRHPRIFVAREIARYHHTFWDGSGHPERVGGKFIPLAARVCAVADAYDAMVCGLASRPVRTMDEALAELRREAGRQFDPELVGCFDTMIRMETEELGMDLASNSGMDDFQELINALQEDRGFV